MPVMTAIKMPWMLSPVLTSSHKIKSVTTININQNIGPVNSTDRGTYKKANSSKLEGAQTGQRLLFFYAIYSMEGNPCSTCLMILFRSCCCMIQVIEGRKRKYSTLYWYWKHKLVSRANGQQEWVIWEQLSKPLKGVFRRAEGRLVEVEAYRIKFLIRG